MTTDGADTDIPGDVALSFVLGQSEPVQPTRDCPTGMVAGEKKDRPSGLIVKGHRSRFVGVEECLGHFGQ